MARKRSDRLKFDLERNRRELLDTVGPIEDLDYVPATGMKSYASQLREIAAMELESLLLIKTGVVPPWEELEKMVVGETKPEILERLGSIRRDVLELLGSYDDESLERAVAVPESWASFVGDTELEAEELFRWLARHEYYHLGQIVSYRWIQGHNPYK